MHNLIRSLTGFYIALFATCFIAINSSCTRDKSNSISCVNGGVYNNGSCTCPIGYQGTNCQTISRQAFLGNWTATGKGTITEGAQYPVSVQAGNPDINDITFTNLSPNYTSPVNAYVINSNLYIPYQTQQGNSIQGTGALTTTASGTTIVISDTVTNLTTNTITVTVITLTE
jgi:hypothetical protein